MSATWKAAVWDRGRYYVRREPDVAAGDARGGVYTFKTRQDAQRYADQLNAKADQPKETRDEG